MTSMRRAVWGLWFGLLAACGSTGDGGGESTSEVADGTCGIAGCDDSVTTTVATTGSGEGGSADSGSTGGAATSGLPCDVADVVERNCLLCHAPPDGLFGAPMSLASAADWQVPAITAPTNKVYELAAQRIDDPVSPMPQNMVMSDADKATLHAWFDAGAPADEGADCGDTTTGGDTDGGVGPDALPCEPTHTFVAGAGDGSGDAFHVPENGADNLYMCFTFASPFGTEVQGTAWAPITDDERVLHHWILFRTQEPQVDGGAGPCNMPSDAVFVSGWAPGGQNFVMPDDVGLELGGPDNYYILQVHYHNVAHHADALDRSGVAFCTTEAPRAHTAGVLTFGTTSIDVPAGATGATATGHCPSSITSLLPVDLNVLASFPHMHGLGRQFDTTVTRAGQDLTLVDVPAFSFDNQVSYIHDPPFVLKAGDSITTTCTYDNPGGSPVHFGERTEDEMCFNFALMWPIEILPPQYRICMTD
ncbi:MAG: hypothetical protein IPH07_12090 [Deltaproteobacteria bacterium]|nr:hypothetical protein [Deltaproteobacteria bacterium]MBP7286291.1 hypothetical protein [Nannocystaceae bacterium]